MSEIKIRNIFKHGAISADFISTEIAMHAKKTTIGAHQIFLGQVRADVLEKGTVNSIEYSAYEEMANEKMAIYREKMFEKYSLTCMHIYHSLGKINVGEICFFVFTSSAHRKDATEACNEIVEFIKKELPIWGKEECENSAKWKVNV